MKEIPSSVFAPVSPPLQTVFEDKEREARRLHLLIHSEVEEDFVASQVLSRPAAQSQKIASLDEMSFSQAIASTQKQAPNVVNESSNMDESSFSQEIPDAQRLFTPAPESDSSHSKSPSSSQPAALVDEEDDVSYIESSLGASPHPAFRAVSEVLDIKTRCGSVDCSDTENQVNVSIDVPLFRPRRGEGDQRVCIEVASESNTCELSVVTKSNFRGTRYEKVVERSTSIGDDRREELCLIVRDNKPNCENASIRKRKNSVQMVDQRPPKSRKFLDYSSSSSSSVVEICQDDVQLSQESDNDSIVLLDPASQDLEKFFCAVEEAQSTTKHFGCNLEEVRDSVEPGERFKLTARINELLPKQPSDDIAGLKSLLIAFCDECSHVWQYHHFINSFSERVIHPRNRPLNSAESEEEECDFGAINYLCSEEDHDRMYQSTSLISLTSLN